MDNKHIYGAEYKDRSTVKERRKRSKRMKSKKADAFLHKEGAQYQSQSFYTKDGGSRQKKKATKSLWRKGKTINVTHLMHLVGS